MRKLLIGLIVCLCIANFSNLVNAQGEYFREDFNYKDDGVVDTTSKNFNVNTHGATPDGTKTISVSQEGYLNMFTEASPNANTTHKAEFRKGNSLIFNQENESMILQVSMKFDQNNRKHISTWFGGGQLQEASTTLKLLSFHNTSFFYNFGNGNSANINFSEQVKINQLYTFSFIFTENHAGNDSITAYIDDTMLYNEELPSNLDFKGQLTSLTVGLENGKTSADMNIDIDYVSVDIYNPLESVSVENKVVNMGDEFSLEVDAVSKYESPNNTREDFIPTIAEGSPLSYNSKTNKFRALQVSENTTVDVLLDFLGVQTTVQITISLDVKIMQNVYENDITLKVGDKLNLNKIFEIIPSDSPNANLLFEGNNNNVLIENGFMTGNLVGETTLTVSSTTYNLSKEVKVNVVNDSIDNMQINDEFNQVSDTNGNFTAVGYGGKTFTPAKVEQDELFGSKISFYGAGASNSGGTHLDTYIPKDSNFTEGKDYKLSGYIKFDTEKATSNFRLGVKIYAYEQAENGNYNFSTAAPNYAISEHTLSQVGNKGWYYFETNTINVDTHIDGVKLEILCFNTEANIVGAVAGLTFVEQETVNTISYGITIENEDIVNNKSITLGTNREVQIEQYTIPSTGTPYSLSYSSSNENVATVENGRILTKDISGKTEITVSNGTKVIVFEINVQSILSSITPNVGQETSITIKSSVKENIIDITFTPSDAFSDVELSYSDENIIKASFLNGKLYVVALADGTVDLTISSKFNPEVKLVISITAEDDAVKDVPVTEITVEKDEIKLDVKGNHQLVAKTNDGATTKLTYVSSDTNVITVDENGLITAVRSGKATITISADGVTKVVNVTVNPLVLDEVEVDKTETSNNSNMALILTIIGSVSLVAISVTVAFIIRKNK